MYKYFFLLLFFLRGCIWIISTVFMFHFRGNVLIWFSFNISFTGQRTRHEKYRLCNPVHFPHCFIPLRSLSRTSHKVNFTSSFCSHHLWVYYLKIGATSTFYIFNKDQCAKLTAFDDFAVKGQWVRCSSCTTSGTTSRCRSAESGCRGGSRTSTMQPRPAAGGTARAWGGGGCIQRSWLSWVIWHQKKSSKR